MSCIVRGYNKNNKVTYIYESTSVWDPEKGYPVPKRRMIGKIDEATGQIVPTGKKGRPRKAPAAATAAMPETTSQEVADLRDELGEANRCIDQLQLEKKTMEIALKQQAVQSEQLRTALKDLKTCLQKSESAIDRAIGILVEGK